MKNWTTTTCEANGITHSYTRTGLGKPTIILLHGLTANGVCWAPVARGLQNHYDLIMVDARGHGRSMRPDFGYRYTDLANDVIGLINALEIPAPILVGHSMGGMTATVVANLSPKILRGLVLADPTFLSAKMQREVRDSDVAEQHRRTLGTSMEQLISDLKARHPDRSKELVELIARAKLQTSMAAFEVLTPPNPDYRQLVSAIEVPTLLVFGDKGVVSPLVAEELRHLNPKLEVRQIADAGHGLHYDQPQRFAAALDSFIRSVSTVARV